MHREWICFDDPSNWPDKKIREMKGIEAPIEYVMGSGEFAEAFLLRDGKYLLQSPLTWYEKPSRFEIAPGYDTPRHRGMTRVINDECMFCHADSIKIHTPEQFGIVEQAIGCQRCHGNGKDHVAFYQTNAEDSVNPSKGPALVAPEKLSRAESESLCAQCHLQGDVVVYAAKKNLWDFRPGELIEQTRMVFQSSDSTKKKFVGHFDQMWESRCYLDSDSLSCVSCHSPHHTPTESEHIDHFRNHCFECHDNHSCGVKLADRESKNRNNCVSCHMPSIDTDVPHVATTNHRIAVYDSVGNAREPETETMPLDPRVDWAQRDLIPISRNTSQFSVIELDRLYWIARGNWLLNRKDLPPEIDFDKELNRTRQALDSVIAESGGDSSSLSMLARITLTQAEILRMSDVDTDSSAVAKLQGDALRYAKQAMAYPDGNAQTKINAVAVLATLYQAVRDYPNAIREYQALTSQRRRASDHYNLALCLAKQRDFAGAQRSLVEAIRCDPAYEKPYRSLGILYQTVDAKQAERLLKVAEALRSRLPLQPE